jgi:hypothetical protein
MGDDVGLDLAPGIIEFDGDKALPGAVFEVFDDALVAGVIGDNQQKILMRLENLAAFFDGQQPA